MEEGKRKKLEAKLRAMFELSKHNQTEKKEIRAQSGNVSVIRRRKGAPDKRILRDLQTEPV